MADENLRPDTTFITVQELASCLERPLPLIRITAKSFEIKLIDDRLSLRDAVHLIRCLANCKGDQAEAIAEQHSKLEASRGREFECAMALEIVKRERNSMEQQTRVLSQQLDRANSRSDRLEQQLHDLTASFTHLVSQRDRLVAHARAESRTSIRQHRGHEVLYLERPINLHLLGQEAVSDTQEP